MNPLFAAVMNAVIHSKRTCPKCRNSQVVSKGRRKEIVICKYCGAEIPPLRK